MIRNSTLISDIKFIWTYLAKTRKWQLFGLFLLMLCSVFAEMLSLGAVVPFIGALTSPESVMKQVSAQSVIKMFNIKDDEELIILLTTSFILLAFWAAFIRMLLLFVNTRLMAKMSVELRFRIFSITLYRPYTFHIANNSSELISIVTDKISILVYSAIQQVLNFFIAFLVAFSIVVTLLMIDSMIAISAFLVLGGSYFFIGYFSRKLLKVNSKKIAESHPLAIKQLQEGVGGIRDVILDNSQESFITPYKSYIKKSQTAIIYNNLIAQIPKFILEFLGIAFIAVLACYFYLSGKDGLPLLAALALGAQRLLPAMQQAYVAWSGILGGESAIADVVKYMRIKTEATDHFSKDIAAIQFNQAIELKDIQFSYNASKKGQLDGISLTIPKGSKVGFIGPTGCGKSTLMDLIMGLLKPTKGELLVDGVVVKENTIKDWQKKIAHVPQSIYLSDNSIAENIAFGIPKDQIDMKQVKIAAKSAQLEKLIESLDNGYLTKVGERGIQLSGGQRQRIGIARALYKQASIIIFDEATSALDEETEANIVNAIDSLDEDLTILMIAHRLSTLKNCDTIYRLSEGKIVGKGSYDLVIKGDSSGTTTIS